MIRWWKRRQILKHGRELAKTTSKLLRMQRDLLSPAQMTELTDSVTALRQAVSTGNAEISDTLAAKLEKVLDRNFPRPRLAAWHENTEVLLVAVIVAMGIRTFFVQPFKIPTGSMQPTLYGIYPPEPLPPSPFPDGVAPSFIERAFGTIFQGRVWKQIGYRTIGDHIFVDKISYHFRRPERGDVIVFETGDIPDIPAPSRGKFYIKRLIGTGGDRIQIKPPHVLVNGDVLDSRSTFQRIYSLADGYNGYVIPETYPPAKFIRAEEDVYKVPDDHYFVLGDNSRSSLDGRFWGGFPRRSLVGRAVLVYWPFSSRFGRIE
jgi:signal peptidase I